MQLAPEAKQAITQHWSMIVQALSVLYASGSVKNVTESMQLNNSVQFIDGFLRDTMLRDCADCAEKEKKG